MLSKKLNIEVDEKTALLYNKATKKQKKSVNLLLYQWLKNDSEKDSLSLLMDKAGLQALENGLNEEKLAELLKD